MSNIMLTEIAYASLETLYMIIISGVLSGLFGLVLGLVLFSTQKNGLTPKPVLFQILGFIVNVLRSVPFIILLALLIPITRLIVGSSIGATATIVPLTIGAIPFFARLVENIFLELPEGLSEAGKSFGATPRQIIFSILLPEALPALVNGLTVLFVTLISYSAMAGAVGGGGLGALAIDYGYQRFNFPVLLTTVVLLVVMVQCIQFLGTRLSRRLTH